MDLEPAEATVTVDGVTVDVGPTGSLVLEVGDHTLQFRAKDHVSETRKVEVLGGQRADVKVALEPAASSATMESTAAPRTIDLTQTAERPEKTPLRKKWWLWTAVGVVAAGAAATVAVMATRDGTTTTQPIGTANTPADGTLGTPGAR